MLQLTPLFPADNKPISIKQGKTGNCYLLAILDCIFNSDQETRDAVKSRFITTPTGVEVRLKRSPNPQSYPHVDQLKGKYGYHYDAATDEDVFFLSHKRLAEIDSASNGVDTNSLAVKILERLVPYYFDLYHWNMSENFASLDAHNLSERFSGSSSAFLANLLNISFHDTIDIDGIIKLKKIYPELAPYISIKYGKPDRNGKIHGRHALRIHKIVRSKNRQGDLQFVLVNPWNNQDQENSQDIYDLADIKSRNPKFCIFSQDPKQIKEMQLYLLLSETSIHYVQANPHLLKQLLQKDIQDEKGIKECIDQHRLTQIFLVVAASPQNRDFINNYPKLRQQLLALPELNKQTIEKHIEHYRQKIQLDNARTIVHNAIYPQLILIKNEIENKKQRKSEQATTQLYKQLLIATVKFLDSKEEEPPQEKIDHFTQRMTTAIHEALPLLKQEITWMNILKNLTKLIANLITGNFSLAKNRYQFFKTTPMIKIIHQLEETISCLPTNSK